MSLVVIIDDRVTNRNIFAKLASSIDADISVRTFADPAEALVWLETNTPDLIITDYKMPSMDGAEFIRCFREQNGCGDIPVVVITVYEERAFRLKALEAGATDFLTSPVDHHEFVTRARNLLKLQKHQLLLAHRAHHLQRELEHSERSRENALRDSREQLAQVIDTLPIMISATDDKGVMQFVNHYHARLMGKESADFVGKSLIEISGRDYGERAQSLDRMVFDTGKALPAYEEEVIAADGVKYTFLTTKSPLRNSDHEVYAVLTSALDITARKQTEAHLRYQAHHDSLTNLPNRVLLRERLRQAVIKARRGNYAFALHMIDLDGFKSINDAMGHLSGDRFIRCVGERLRHMIREHDILARLGGDEFAVLQENVSTPEDAAKLAERLCQAINAETHFEDRPIRVSASIGIALSATDGPTSDDLLKNADLAMYRAKAQDGNHFCFYSVDMNTHAQQNAQLDMELTRALQRQQFELYYQPIVNLATGHICGAEALLRWNKPESGVVTPGAFMARVEETGMIIDINHWVINEACRQARQWEKAKLNLHVGVNLSALQFRKTNVPLQIAKALADSGLSPCYLDLELTESIIMQDLDAAARDLGHLRDLGVHISMDDFGTGYSSLNYIKKLPINCIKIDQSFIRTITNNVHDRAIVRAIITMAHSLKLDVLAEGVETADQLAILRDEQCNLIQGYYFGRPMPATDFINLVMSQKDKSSAA
jgi:diguanylate cyclase (GGDEF)-like protein/PAS domain S-box-containing protein